MDYNEIERAALKAGGCSKEQALWAVENLDKEQLCGLTTHLREKEFGNNIRLCTIINARSGCCSEDCRYCSQSAHNSSDVEVFELLDEDALIRGAEISNKSNAHNFGIVTSGASVEGDDLTAVCKSIEQIADSATLPDPCGSFGRMNTEQLAQLKDAGLVRYHHNLETSENFYSQICTTHEWFERVETVSAALSVGLQVCSGGLFGLGENWEDRADLAAVLKNLGVDSVPLNFLHSHVGTPLADMPPLESEEALRIIALYRLMLPAVTLRICGGRPKILGARMNEMFAYGANAFMTGDYLTTSGITPATDRELVEAEGLIIEE